MNERIKELIEQSKCLSDGYNTGAVDLEKFAELIVQECIKEARGVGDLRGINDDMIYGADHAALKIARHFGVEE